MDYFDLHCDTATSGFRRGISFLDEGTHVSLLAAQGLERWCQFFAVFTPDRCRGEDAYVWYCDTVARMKSRLDNLRDHIIFCPAFSDIEKAFAKGRAAAVLTVESAAPLCGNIDHLQRFIEDSVRVVTVTWNGENELGYGIGVGGHLKPFGRDAVREMMKNRILIDVSHASDEGFADILDLADQYDGKVIATHSNLRSVCAHKRNLPEDAFKRLMECNAMVGLNFNKPFLHVEDALADKEDALLRHIDRMLELGGRGNLCIGSDFDGADMPDYCRDLSCVSEVRKMISLRFGEEIADDILFGNAFRYFSAI